MITQKLQTIFSLQEAPVLFSNTEYAFQIRLLEPKELPYKILFTEGMATYDQPVDEQNLGLKNIELYFLLPDYWELEKENWPVHWLNRIAQVPQKNKTWFGSGDTLPAGNPPKEINEEYKFSYFILSQPMLMKPFFDEELNQQMLAVIPIFKKEFDFKIQNSSIRLFQLFQDKKVYELVDKFRTPVARKKFMGVF